MPHPPHSRAWYTELARELGGYRHPWRRTLTAPDPELAFDMLLLSLLTPGARVLEAGCGDGPDARRFGGQVSRWVGYDFVPELLNLARQRAPHAEFHGWDGRGELPAPLRGPFDLVVSRRGPTSVILRLNELTTPDARFLYVGPRLEVPQVPERLAQAGWQILAEHRVSVLAHVPTWEDWQLRCAFMNEPARREDWEAGATAAGMPYREERHLVLAALNSH